ncbi:hypothetical protein DFH07DRAFT_954756 [Mycena maculata]|uniref:Uncharacterized protein n=1 Tax=Mycena maculata TaxID=230809 RepID=A0AAD7JM67_9AGAR|nr:hypothetical protein DFH07DRAFT_954756 [Mycena maculata]
MAQTVVSPKGYTITFLVLVIFFASPFILAAFPQTAAFAPPLFWAGDKLLQGLIVVCLFGTIVFLHLLFSDFRQWLARTPTVAPASTPTDLESGTAAAPDLIVLDTEVGTTKPAAVTPSSSAPEGPTTTRKIVSLVLNSWVVINYFLTHDIMSLKKSLMENVGATLLFVLRGLEVIFVALLLLGFVAWLVKSKPDSPSGEAATVVLTAPAAAPVEVLVMVEETVVEVVPASKGEKA